VQNTTRRFIAIDGLRAWMAWLVVGSHVVQQSGLRDGGSIWHKCFEAGNLGVQTFIIISGFVITHLLIERPQGYMVYLIPRFMRLFPAFVLSCVIGGVAYAVAARWGDPGWFSEIHGELYASQVRYLTMHLLAHLTMLHGAIPNTILPLSEYAFLPPAWSVSLEWQFYLIAPAVVWCCRRGDRAAYLVIAISLCAALYSHRLGMLWRQPGVLIGAGFYFLIGISCRLWISQLAGKVKYPAAVGLGIGFVLLHFNCPSLAVWLVVYSFMLKSPSIDAGLDRAYIGLVSSLLESRFTQVLAERSYSTYLLHWSVIMLIGTVAVRMGIPVGPKLALTMLLVFPITVAIQEPVYRYVEIPGRRLGKRWSQLLVTRTMIQVRQESGVNARA
jgi:peptidoglycan/LPS O-acetylase OafA/YrhL